jgi:predicted DNA-binding protein YlxM (UPF0122 family)
MTNSVYIIHHSLHHGGYDWEKEVAEIKAINPNSILCMCMEEFDYLYIFRNFFPKITPWLIENDKIIKVLVPNPDNVKINDHIITESTSGIYMLFADLLLEELPNTAPDRLFTCYNNNPKLERALLVDELARRHLLQHGIVTFHFPNNVFSDSVTNEPFNGWKYHDGSALKDEEDYCLNATDDYVASAFPRSYLRGFIDVVTESNIRKEEFFFTEKTGKSVAALKPFIALANPYYHTRFLVDEFGFELYDELFDYSFDTMVDTTKRIEMIVDNVERLIDMFYNESVRTELYETIKPKLLRNKERLIQYGLDKNKIVPRSLRFLLHDQSYHLNGNVDALEKYTLSYYRHMGWIK